ncbi:MAG TPA: hypothetical protein VL122_08020 [Nitrospirota bacterium]|nr:hypothetical protein [Nitrospirota bacterium]
MNRILKLYHRIAIAIVVLWCTSVVMVHSAVAAPRAVWIWEEDSYLMLDKDAVQREVETFLDRQHISTMYVYADEFNGRNILVNEPDKYRKLIASAHARGFKVFALLGSAYLRTQEYVLPEKRPVALRMFRNVLEFNKNTPDVSSRFDGVNIDIEPYLLDDWSSARPLRVRQYLDLSAEFMRMKAAVGSRLLVGPAMPFWYDGIEDVEWNGQRRRLNERIQDIYDYVALMDYRNVAEGPDGIVSLAQDELDYADRIEKKVMIGVETLETTPAKVTFYGKGEKYFETQLALAESAMTRHRSFGGFVVHHLKSYRVLVEEKQK